MILIFVNYKSDQKIIKNSEEVKTVSQELYKMLLRDSPNEY